MDILTAINNAAFQFAGSIASQSLTFAMSYLAMSYYFVLAGLVVFLYLKRDKNVFAFIVALLVLFVISEILKMLVQEPRPCQVQTFSWTAGICESGFSFPSSHATVLSGVYFFVKGYRYLNILYVIWLILVLFGRVYLGVHYLTDVIAGVMISIVAAAAIYRYRELINPILLRVGKRVFGPIFQEGW